MLYRRGTPNLKMRVVAALLSVSFGGVRMVWFCVNHFQAPPGIETGTAFFALGQLSLFLLFTHILSVLVDILDQLQVT